MHTITMMSGGNMGEAQRWALKDRYIRKLRKNSKKKIFSDFSRPFTIIINNEIDEEEEEEEEHEMTKPENTTENRGPRCEKRQNYKKKSQQLFLVHLQIVQIDLL